MASTLLLDCSSGIAGDMLVASLLDLGASELGLRAALDSLRRAGLGDFDVVISRVNKNGIDACDFDVVLDEEHQTHDHDMAWLHPEDPTQALGHEHEHDHGHGHEHSHHHGHHEHRTLADVLAILEPSDLSRRARDIAENTFRILAAAEATAHGTTPDAVHFHEVGAIDSVVDIAAAAFCLDNLDVERVIVEDLAEGKGTIRCAHGMMPIPVPAVMAVCEAHGITLRSTGVHGELVTPTGAALVAAIRTDDTAPERYTVKACGIGAGKRDYACPGIVRALLLDESVSTQGVLSGPRPLSTPAAPRPDAGETIWKVECDIDDVTGEALGHVIDRLMSVGAREAHCLPLVTKKGRPAWQLQAICPADMLAEVESVIFEDTTTIGIRRQAMERTVLDRRQVTVHTSLGDARAKEVILPNGSHRTYPEHDDVARLAERAGVGYQDALQAVTAACAERGHGPSRRRK